EPVRDPDDAGPGRRLDQADRPRHRPPVVVGDPLSGERRGHGERDPHPGADAGSPRGADRRRDPQLLGAAAEPEDRHAPGRDERDRALRRRGRAVPRRVRRVLRPAARAHGPVRVHRAAGALRAVARRPGEARRRAERLPGGAGAGRVHERHLLELPRDPRDQRERQRRARPDAPRRPDDDRGPQAAEHPAAPARLDRRPPALQARQRDAERAHPARRAARASRVSPRAALMAVATPPSPAAAERVERLEAIWESRPGVLGWLTTTDHKRIGLLYFWTTLALFGAGGIEALLIRTQLIKPENDLVSPETSDQLFTLHGITMIFFFIIPMTTGAFGNYLIPLMIGARDMAFPRMNALSFWVFLASAIFLYTSLALGMAPNAGWFDY